MRRVLLVQPALQPPGGGNGVAAWMLQALARQHRVTVLSWVPVEVEPINRFFGTSLSASDFDRLIVPRRWRAALDSLPVPAALLRSSLLMRYVHRVSDAFDVIVGAHNEIDYGRRGIQYVHYPTYLRPRPAVDLRWYHRWGWMLNRYYALADRIAGFSIERMRANLTLVNSNWTAARVRALLGVDAATVYPPVVVPEKTAPWDRRQARFVAIGRISPEKDYERIIRILTRVRAHAPEVTLTIVGTSDRRVRRYYDQLRTLAASSGPWITFRHDVSRDSMQMMLRESRYGMHGMAEEHFGMAPAEMAAAGMIVWVPNGGGQVEIVDGEPALIFESDEQAAESILRVLASYPEQQRLRERLAARSAHFSTSRFVGEIQAIVAGFRE